MSSGILMGNTAALGIATVTINPASVATATSAEQTFTVPGLKVGDAVFVCKPSATAGVGVVNARVSAADTLAITFMNATGLAVDPGSESYLVAWIRSDATHSSVVA